MKSRLLLATALTALSFSAFAADLPARTFAPVSPAPIFSWTGFYVGGTVGSLTASFKNTLKYIDSISDINTSNASTAASATLGAAVGYNHQFGNIVAGLEADYNFANAKSYFADYEVRTSLGSFGTFRGRLGYAFDRTLIFATAGVAVAHISGSTTIGDDASFNKLKSGWVAGGGVEHALTNMLTVKAEALYADFGSASSTKVVSFPSPVGIFTNTTEFKSKTSAVIGRVGMNFKF